MPIWPFGIFARRPQQPWEARLSSSAPLVDEGAALRGARATLTAILHENLLPFWTERIPRTADDQGIFLAEERNGRRVLNLILLARYLWFVSTLAGGAHRQDIHVELAHRSYRQLRERLHDEEHGGFFWEHDLGARAPNKPNKHLYGQAFAIYALARYGMATGNRDAIDLARSTFAVLEARARDSKFGGYREWFERDWRPGRGPGYLGWEARFKLINTQMHLLEALTALFTAAPEDLLRSRIAELVGVLSARTVSPRFAVALDCRLENWAPLRRRRNDRISYGHDVEAIFLLLEASDALGADRDVLADHFRQRFAYCVDFGFDFDKGGFFDHGPLGHAAASKTKIWWVQAEALLSSLTMYRLTAQRPYLAVFEKTLRWIDGAQVDWQGGEWHRQIEPNGTAGGAKVDRWKCPYHNGRATLTCLSLLDELL